MKTAFSVLGFTIIQNMKAFSPLSVTSLIYMYLEIFKQYLEINNSRLAYLCQTIQNKDSKGLELMIKDS